MSNQGYPVFLDPERYMKCRVSYGPLGRLKMWSEHRALDRCLAATTGVNTVFDVPCGPGRLFPYWMRRGLGVTAMDMSEPMIEVAAALHHKLGLEGSVSVGDAFQLEGDAAKADLVASVRFVYYFEPEKRIALFRSLAAASRRYVLIQYKTSATWKGHRNDARSRSKRRSKHFSTRQQILDEVRAAGLIPLRVEPIGEFSDRAFVIAEKAQPAANGSQSEHADVHVSPAPGRVWASALRWVTRQGRPEE
jgi:SAM-dependent methyltransferase